MEYQVFLKARLIKPNVEKRVHDYAIYTNTEFICAFYDNILTGVVRLIYPDNPKLINELPTLKQFSISVHYKTYIESLPPKRLAEIGTMAILPAYRKGKTAQLLRRKIITYPISKGYRYGLSLIDQEYFNYIRNLGYQISQIGESRHYMGSLTVPTLVNAYDLPKTFWYWMRKRKK